MFSEISLLLKEPNTARNCLQSHFHVSLTLIFKPPYSVGNFISIYDSLMDLWGYYFTLPETRKGLVTKSPNTMWKSSKVTEYYVKKGWNNKTLNFRLHQRYFLQTTTSRLWLVQWMQLNCMDGLRIISILKISCLMVWTWLLLFPLLRPLYSRHYSYRLKKRGLVLQWMLQVQCYSCRDFCVQSSLEVFPHFSINRNSFFFTDWFLLWRRLYIHKHYTKLRQLLQIISPVKFSVLDYLDYGIFFFFFHYFSLFYCIL